MFKGTIPEVEGIGIVVKGIVISAVLVFCFLDLCDRLRERSLFFCFYFCFIAQSLFRSAITSNNLKTNIRKLQQLLVSIFLFEFFSFLMPNYDQLFACILLIVFP